MSDSAPRPWWAALEPGQLVHYVPHSAALGTRFVEAGPGHAVLRVPWSEQLVGNPDTGVLHGGVITAVLDNASGMAVGSTQSQPGAIATLDLRIDYMKPATPRRDVFARAECYKRTRNVAFVRGVAYHDDPADPIATTVATFMLDSNRSRVGDRD
jgi:uncharacterized protein (TIGR00369 family)